MIAYRSIILAVFTAAAAGACSSSGVKPSTAQTPAAAQQAPSAASLEALFDLQDFDRLISDSFRQMPAAAVAQAANSLTGVPAGRREAVEQVLQKYLTLMSDEINTPELRSQMRRAAMEGAGKVYTQGEVDALIAFYRTPEGRSVMDKMPKYMEATMLPLTQALSPKMHAAQQKYMPQMTKEINRAVCGKDKCPQKGAKK